MKFCERCLEEYADEEVYISKYFSNYYFCIPCEKEYERKLQIMRLEFLNDKIDLYEKNYGEIRLI